MSGMDRRRFFKVTAITGTSAALAGCGNPEHQLMRFVPEEAAAVGPATVGAERRVGCAPSGVE